MTHGNVRRHGDEFMETKDDKSLVTGKKQGSKANKTSFKKGVSGNPKGRPKLSEDQKDALTKIKELAPMAVDVAEKLLKDGDVAPAVKVKLIDMILDRTYGKPYQSVEIKADDTAETGVVIIPARGGANE